MVYTVCQLYGAHVLLHAIQCTVIKLPEEHGFRIVKYLQDTGCQSFGLMDECTTKSTYLQGVGKVALVAPFPIPGP